jgi:hypothetical protein
MALRTNLLLAALLAAGCKSDVAVIHVGLKADASGTLRITALDAVESRSVAPSDALPIGGIDRGEVGRIGIKVISATFANVREVDLGGMSFDWTEGKGERILRVRIPAGASAPWRRLAAGPEVVRSLDEAEAGVRAKEGGAATRSEAGRRGRSVIDLEVEMPGAIVAQWLDPAAAALGWSHECDDAGSPCGTDSHLLIPLRATGAEPDTVLWEIRSRAE